MAPMATEKLKLQLLDRSAYDDFMATLQVRYARDRMESNLLSEDEAIQFTQTQWASFLPQGQSTEGHFFFDLIDESNGVRVGASWLFVDQTMRSSFIFELYLEPDSRGKGLGKSALRALEDFAKTNGAKTLGLNVFATNERAKSLYDSFGFRDVSTDMIKSI